MRLPNLHTLDTVSEALNVVTSRKRLKQFLDTPLYANAFYLMLNTVVMSLLGFFFWMVVARFYTEAEVGYSSAILSILNLLALLSLLGLSFSLIRFLPQAEKPEELMNSCFTLSGLVSLVAAGVFLVGIGFWSPALAFIKESAVFSTVFVVCVLMWTLSVLLDSTFIAKRRAGFVLSKNTIFSLLKIPLPILFVLFFHSFGIVASWGIALGISVVIYFLVFLPRVQNLYKPVPTLNLNLMKGMWQYSGGNYLADLLSAAPVYLLPLIVVNLLSPESNAYFYIAWMMATLLFAIPYAVSQSLFAEGSHFEGRLRENVRKSFKFTFLLLVPALILLILVSKWLLLAFGQSYIINALSLLQILAISSLPLGINNIYATILKVRGRLKELTAIYGVIAAVTLFTSYLIAPVTGIIGIGYAWLGIQSAVAIYVVLSLKRVPST